MSRRPPTHIHRHTGKPVWEFRRRASALAAGCREEQAPIADLTDIVYVLVRDGSLHLIAACDLDNEMIFIRMAA